MIFDKVVVMFMREIVVAGAKAVWADRQHGPEQSMFDEAVRKLMAHVFEAEEGEVRARTNVVDPVNSILGPGRTLWAVDERKLREFEALVLEGIAGEGVPCPYAVVCRRLKDEHTGEAVIQSKVIFYGLIGDSYFVHRVRTDEDSLRLAPDYKANLRRIGEYAARNFKARRDLEKSLSAPKPVRKPRRKK